MYFVLNCFGFNGVSCKCHSCWHRIIDRNKKHFFPNKNNLISTFFFTSLLNSVELLVVAPECLSLFHPLQGARVVHHGESTGPLPTWQHTYTVYLGWLCCWFSPLLWGVFLQALQLSPLPKNHHFQIPNFSSISSTHLHEFLRKPKCLM